MYTWYVCPCPGNKMQTMQLASQLLSRVWSCIAKLWPTFAKSRCPSNCSTQITWTCYMHSTNHVGYHMFWVRTTWTVSESMAEAALPTLVQRWGFSPCSGYHSCPSQRCKMLQSAYYEENKTYENEKLFSRLCIIERYQRDRQHPCPSGSKQYFNHEKCESKLSRMFPPNTNFVAIPTNSPTKNWWSPAAYLPSFYFFSTREIVGRCVVNLCCQTWQNSSHQTAAVPKCYHNHLYTSKQNWKTSLRRTTYLKTACVKNQTGISHHDVVHSL